MPAKSQFSLLLRLSLSGTVLKACASIAEKVVACSFVGEG